MGADAPLAGAEIAVLVYGDHKPDSATFYSDVDPMDSAFLKPQRGTVILL
jgi:hypothetical protein